MPEGYAALIESGARRMPGADVALKYAQALDVSIEWLVDGVGRGAA
jgi:hypothetical protein